MLPVLYVFNNFIKDKEKRLKSLCGEDTLKIHRQPHDFLDPKL